MKKTKQAAPVSDELIDAWLKQGRKPEDVHGLLRQLTKLVVERAMQGEMAEHLGYEKHDPEGNNSGNSRNGGDPQALKGDFGEVEVETPRDRNGEFEPRIVQKNQTRWAGFDDKIVSFPVSRPGHNCRPRQPPRFPPSRRMMMKNPQNFLGYLRTHQMCARTRQSVYAFGKHILIER